MWPSGLMALYILGILMQWFLLWNTFTTKHFPHDNYEWNIPNVHECHGSQCETSMTIARTVVLNHLFWVFKWAGHTTQVCYAPVPLEIPGSELSLLQVECVLGGGGGGVPGVRSAEDIPRDGMWDSEQKGGLSRGVGIDFLGSQEPPIRVKRHGQGTTIRSDWKHGSYFLRPVSALRN